MSGLAARLDPCVNWLRVVARTKGRILWIFPAALLAAYAATLWRDAPLSRLDDYIRQRRANAPILAEARALKLDYETVAAKPADFAGKPVVWCVDTPSQGVSYVNGVPSRVVILEGVSYDEYRTSSGSAGYCWNVLAVVGGAKDGKILLRPLEKW